MVFNVRNSNRSFFIFFILFIVYYISYALFMPTFEYPDEALHFKHVLETNKLTPNIYGDGNLYYFLISKINIFLNKIFEYSKEIFYQYNNDFQYFNDDFRFIHHKSIVHFELLQMRLSNLFLDLVFFFVYFFMFKTRVYNLLLFSVLLFPGILSFFTAINPDNLNILVAWIVSLLVINQKNFTAIILMFFFFPHLDRSIFIFFGSLLFYLSLKILKNKIYILIMYFSIFFVLSTSLVYMKELITGINTSYEPIKSIFTLVVSYYGLLGNMSIKASYIEYFIFFIIIALYLKNVILFYLFSKKNNFYLIHFIIIYFIIWNFIIFVAPSLDQGRFFYPLHFILMYALLNRYKTMIICHYNMIVFWLLIVSFIINYKFIIKLLLLGDIF